MVTDVAAHAYTVLTSPCAHAYVCTLSLFNPSFHRKLAPRSSHSPWKNPNRDSLEESGPNQSSVFQPDFISFSPLRRRTDETSDVIPD